MIIKAETKATIIYHDLKKKILANMLPAETHLIIRQLSKEYGTSDIPVREALKELTAEGILETIPHIGSKVRGISQESIRGMLEMRELLEPVAARLAVKRITPEQFHDLKECWQDMMDAYNRQALKEYSKDNRAFHSILIKACGNDCMQKTLENLIIMEKRIQTVFELFPEIIEDSYREHAEMIHFIEQKNGSEMEKLMAKHKKRAFDKMRLYFKIRTNDD
ncbi:MAG: GntR family transcriptional regulator [Veillonellales bacterium]